MLHININSLQNKFEELKLINDKLRASIIILTKTKIDSMYPESQFKLNNYCLFRNDRVKGGGGVLAYVRSGISAKRLKLMKIYNTLEPIILDVNIGGCNFAIIGLYRPPRSVNYTMLQDDLFHLCSWLFSHRESVIILGDLNLDRLKPNSREGKILQDIEDIFDFTCLIQEPTQITPTTSTLLDVILTNKADMFDHSGVIDLGLSDHAMIYGFLKPKVKRYPMKIISFRRTVKMNELEMKKDMEEAMCALNSDNTLPVDEQCKRWNTEVNNMLDKHMPPKSMRVRAKTIYYC